MNERSFEAQRQLGPRIYEYVLAGLLLATMAGVVVGYHVYHGFVTEEISQERAYWGIGLPFAVVALGLYIFAYGWERGDVGKALRMALFLSLGAVAILVAVLGALALKGVARKGASYLGFGDGSRRRRTGYYYGGYDPRRDDDSPFGPDDGDLPRVPEVFTVHCRNCGDLFVPEAPRAQCPSCGHSALDNPQPA